MISTLSWVRQEKLQLLQISFCFFSLKSLSNYLSKLTIDIYNETFAISQIYLICSKSFENAASAFIPYNWKEFLNKKKCIWIRNTNMNTNDLINNLGIEKSNWLNIKLLRSDWFHHRLTKVLCLSIIDSRKVSSFALSLEHDELLKPNARDDQNGQNQGQMDPVVYHQPVLTVQSHSWHRVCSHKLLLSAV